MFTRGYHNFSSGRIDSKGYHIDGFRCDAISSMILGGSNWMGTKNLMVPSSVMAVLAAKKTHEFGWMSRNMQKQIFWYGIIYVHSPAQFFGHFL